MAWYILLQILPDETVWLPKLVEHIVDIAVSSAQPVDIDKKLIEGPNANKRGKLFIPILLLLQVKMENVIHTSQILLMFRQFTEGFVLVFD